MKKYTVGFIFNQAMTHVLLIRKTKPVEQAGLLNGIGGKFEPEDVDAEHCVSREVKEEAGLDIPSDQWFNAGYFGDNVNYRVDILTAQVSDDVLHSAQTLTEEQVSVFSIDELKSDDFVYQAEEMLEYCRRCFS